MQNARSIHRNGPTDVPLPLGIDVPQPDGGTEISFPDDPTGEMHDGAFVAEGPDGGVTINLDPQDSEAAPGEFANLPHNANLAEHLPESTLNKIGAQIVEAVAEDLRSRTEWESQLAEGIKYLGLKIEDRTRPFKGASGVYDPMILQANMRFQATARGELLPAGGPVKTEVIGAADDDTMARAQRVKSFMNLYLTELAPEYYADYVRMLWWCGLDGSAFKKVYQDSILSRPVSPFLSAKDVIVPYGASDLSTAERITHQLRMSEREIKLRQRNGEYLATVELNDPDDPNSTAETSYIQQATDRAIGSTPTGAEIDKWFTVYECHLNLDIPGVGPTEDLPLPYRVTVEKNTQRVLAIYRNWDERDDSFQRKEWFVHYCFIPGMGFYGLGYAHILGNSARAATAIRRQMIDAATLAMMPSGLRAKGARMTDNNITLAPMEFAEVETGGQPINNFIMALPFKGPDQSSIELLRETYKAAEQIASSAEVAVGEGRQDAPVGTTVALIEAATRIESGVMKGLHNSLKRELRMIAALFGEMLPANAPYPFAVPGGQQVVMKSDFSGHIDVIPVSDPNITSSTQRLVRAQAQLQLAQQAPQIHDMREAYIAMYTEMGLDEDKIAKLLPQPQQAQPMDPLSENMAAMMQKPVAAAPWQDHDAHIAVHQPLLQIPEMAAHIAEHTALKMRVQVEQLIGHPLPPPGAQLPPEIQNQIAMMVAQAMQVLQQQAQAAAGGGPQDPQIEIAREAIQVQAMDVMRKYNEAKVKAAADANKVWVQSQDRAADRDVKLQIARIKSSSSERVRGLPQNFTGQ